jgi:2-keto-4-pentenoate hydratase/2-oxohepta-3-ene-1,7-dioic acid hydratase in catechol pathway
MRWGTLQGGGLAALVDDRAVWLPAWERDGLVDVGALVAAPQEVLARVTAEATQAPGVRAAGVPLGPPLRRPSKIVCVGLNYRDHAAESSLELPAQPLLFSKFPSSIVGPGDEIAWPAGVTEQVDWEAELAVVMGLDGAVFGYTVANDVSARDVQFADGQWTRGKSIDTFCPTGPTVVTADEVPDPQALRVRARVNGETLQDAPTSDMVFGVAEIVAYCARSFTLEPGDLILTGTPPGVGAFRSPPVWLSAGDVVEVAVDGIGVLANPVGGPR